MWLCPRRIMRSAGVGGGGGVDGGVGGAVAVVGTIADREREKLTAVSSSSSIALISSTTVITASCLSDEPVAGEYETLTEATLLSAGDGKKRKGKGGKVALFANTGGRSYR